MRFLRGNENRLLCFHGLKLGNYLDYALILNFLVSKFSKPLPIEIRDLEETTKNYELIEEIYKGLFSVVWKAKHLLKDTIVAIKCINSSSQKIKEQISNEVANFSKISHPLSVQYLGSYENNSNSFIVMEFFPGETLLNFINRHPRLGEHDSLYIFYQLISVIEHLHKSSIIHRDIKLDNIMIDSNLCVRLLDYGLSKALKSESQKLFEKCGSFEFMSPEMAKNQAYDTSIDIWSLGVVLYSLVHQRLPFAARDTSLLIQKIIYGEPQYSRELSANLIDLLERMLQKDPSERITIDEIKRHQWVTQMCFSPLDNLILNCENELANESNFSRLLLIKNKFTSEQSKLFSQIKQKNLPKKKITKRTQKKEKTRSK